jgi:acyl carrier protein
VPVDVTTFIQEFESSLHGISAGTLSSNTPFKDLDEWDSVALLNIIGLIDIEFNTQISADAILRCQTVLDVYQLATKSSVGS